MNFHGTLINEATNEPVEGALIATLHDSTLSDDNGAFSLSTNDTGDNAYLHIAATGFDTLAFPWKEENGTQLSDFDGATIKLQPAPGTTTSTVTITAQRKKKNSGLLWLLIALTVASQVKQ